MRMPFWHGIPWASKPSPVNWSSGDHQLFERPDAMRRWDLGGVLPEARAVALWQRKGNQCPAWGGLLGRGPWAGRPPSDSDAPDASQTHG